MPDQRYAVSRVQHRAMGTQIRLSFADDIELRFTPAEASSLSLALVAVSRGISPEREIYMSPIASDAAFIGQVGDSGITITLHTGEAQLDWPQTEALATALAEAIG